MASAPNVAAVTQRLSMAGMGSITIWSARTGTCGYSALRILKGLEWDEETIGKTGKI